MAEADVDPEVLNLLKKAFGARARMEDGIYCECVELVTLDHDGRTPQ